MTSVFSWQNSISLCPASFCTPTLNLPVTPGVSWLPAFAFQSSIMKTTYFLDVSSKRSCTSSQNRSTSTWSWSWSFPDSSVDKESACYTGDPWSIPGSGRSVGEGIGYPLQYSWASLVAQLVKNPPKMWDLGLIPGLGRSPGEGKGCPLQYSGL